ncbi:late embryogenesis abundant protein, LEA5 [Tanacetum coccineum]
MAKAIVISTLIIDQLYVDVDLQLRLKGGVFGSLRGTGLAMLKKEGEADSMKRRKICNCDSRECIRMPKGKWRCNAEKGGEDSKKSTPWIPDPVTGYHKPEGRTNQVDVVDQLRELILKQKKTSKLNLVKNWIVNSKDEARLCE